MMPTNGAGLFAWLSATFPHMGDLLPHLPKRTSARGFHAKPLRWRACKVRPCRGGGKRLRRTWGGK